MEKAKNNIIWKKVARVVLWTMGVLVGLALLALLFYGRTIKRAYDEAFRTEITTVGVAMGDSWSKILETQGIARKEADSIVALLRQLPDGTSLRADREHVKFVRVGSDKKLTKIIHTVSPWRYIELVYNDETGTWTCNPIDVARDTRTVYREGKIGEGDSFWVAAARVKIQDNIIDEVYNKLAFEIDFERDIRVGQKFFVVYDENYIDNKPIDAGNIRAISFDALRGNVNMYQFVKSDNKIGYYDKNGNGATKSLKRTPLKIRTVVTSGFSSSRKHPVLGFTRAHKGVDFRAATGTPIPAAGDGQVVARGFNRGHGNFVKIRHNKTFETLYAHMSKFKSGVNVGTHVIQGQTIGYVGSTGLSTGPHLHYEIIKNGTHVNPLTVTLPPIDSLSAEDKARFLKYREEFDKQIEELKKNPSSFIQR
ncbi:MAG: M23 family metallopeptidase [Alphaproteobacteria bacterium]|nr:M23 family metallopeptidase [Alphaproteobacteria bacterium]